MEITTKYSLKVQAIRSKGAKPKFRLPDLSEIALIPCGITEAEELGSC